MRNNKSNFLPSSFIVSTISSVMNFFLFGMGISEHSSSGLRLNAIIPGPFSTSGARRDLFVSVSLETDEAFSTISVGVTISLAQAFSRGTRSSERLSFHRSLISSCGSDAIIPGEVSTSGARRDLFVSVSLMAH